jgi:hypothetical protein
VPARTVKEKLPALAARQEQFEADLAAAPEARQPLLHPNLAEVYRRKVAVLAEALAEDAMQDEAFELIRALIDNIVLVPEGEELGIEIHGELAGILDAVPAKQNARPEPASLAQIKVLRGHATTYTERLWHGPSHTNGHCCGQSGFATGRSRQVARDPKPTFRNPVWLQTPWSWGVVARDQLG